MKVHIDIDNKNEETSVTVHAKEWSEELDSLIKTLKNAHSERIVGIDQEQSVLLHPKDIDYIFAEQKKVFAALGQQRVELKMRLYEAEELLYSKSFLRFSKSVIGNVKRIQRFEVTFNGNLSVHFKSGNKEYVSRKYVTSLKEQFLHGGL